MVLKKMKNKLSNKSYKYQALMDHPVHEDHRKARSKYSEAIIKVKKDHWDAFLEGMSHGEVWIANRYISSNASDSGKTCSPMLTQQHNDPSLPPMVASTNDKKSQMLAKLMFPIRPSGCTVRELEEDNQLPSPCGITEEQIQRHLARLSPFKAPRADKIPNIVLKKSAKLIIPYLLQIFRATLSLRTYASQWRDITTCILWKPGKPRYDIPKAYHPITLVNTIVKLLSSIVTDDIMHLAETH